MNDYKWTLKRIDRLYTLTGYHMSVEGDWIQDGPTTSWSHIESPLEYIAKFNRERLNKGNHLV